MKVLKYVLMLGVSAFATNAMAKDYIFNFNNQQDLKGWEFTLPFGSNGRTTDYSLQDGFLRLEMKHTDTGGPVQSPRLDLSNDFQITIRHRMNKGGSVFLPSISLQDESATPSNYHPRHPYVGIGFPQSSYLPDGDCSMYSDVENKRDKVDYPTFSIRENGARKCFDEYEGGVRSSDFYSMWLETTIAYRRSSCNIKLYTESVDGLGDKYIEASYGLSNGFCRHFKPSRLAISGYGWNTGHSMDIDWVKIKTLGK